MTFFCMQAGVYVCVCIMYLSASTRPKIAFVFLPHTLISKFYSVGASNIGDVGVKSIAAARKSLNTLEAL